jgi:hypothetical protein
MVTILAGLMVKISVPQLLEDRIEPGPLIAVVK